MKNIVLLVILITINSCSLFKSEEQNYHKGYFSYIADAAIFVDCKTNQKYPVAMEGDYIKLEEKYLQVVKTGGEKIIVTLNGKIVEKDKIEGEGRRDFLVVDKFLDIFPNENCN